jgi:nucleotide-binding universal stress UspA family protein
VAVTVIAAVDNSPAAMQAVRLLAGYEGDRSLLAIVLLNVQSRPTILWPGPAFDPGAIESALLREGAAQLEPARALLVESGFEPEAAVRLSFAPEAIIDEAHRRGAKAIVMGTRGHGPLGGFALGSVALRVAHRAQVPTLLVRPDTRLPRALGRTVRVLVPLDGSTHATGAVTQVLGWEEWLGDVEFDLVHVRPALTRLETLMPPHDDVLDEWGSKQSEEATRDARARLYAARRTHRFHEAVGDAPQQIARLADEAGSELVVMGTRGLGAVHHALLGSVALKVAHASSVPVVLVP